MQKEFLSEKKENEDSLIVKGGKGAQERKREIAAKVCPGMLLVLFLFIFNYFGIPVYIHSRFSGCFREVVLADWSGH